MDQRRRGRFDQIPVQMIQKKRGTAPVFFVEAALCGTKLRHEPALPEKVDPRTVPCVDLFSRPDEVVRGKAKSLPAFRRYRGQVHGGKLLAKPLPVFTDLPAGNKKLLQQKRKSLRVSTDRQNLRRPDLSGPRDCKKAFCFRLKGGQHRNCIDFHEKTCAVFQCQTECVIGIAAQDARPV